MCPVSWELQRVCSRCARDGGLEPLPRGARIPTPLPRRRSRCVSLCRVSCVCRVCRDHCSCKQRNKHAASLVVGLACAACSRHAKATPAHDDPGGTRWRITGLATWGPAAVRHPQCHQSVEQEEEEKVIARGQTWHVCALRLPRKPTSRPVAPRIEQNI